ncbi:MAG: zinc ribbon domain-containing protein [Nitrosopumilaceae archaeon]|jgi:hypothetical protein
MNKFESELKKGNFIISECVNCKEIVWPPSNYCNKCFGHVKWRNPSEIGKLIEFSKKENVNFCIAEFEEKIRIMGTLIGEIISPKIGQRVKLKKCGLNDGQFNFTMALI